MRAEYVKTEFMSENGARARSAAKDGNMRVETKAGLGQHESQYTMLKTPGTQLAYDETGCNFETESQSPR